MLARKLPLYIFFGFLFASCCSYPDLRPTVDRRLDLDDISVIPYAAPLPKKDGIRDVYLRQDSHGQRFLLFRFNYKEIGFALLRRLEDGRIIGPRVEIRDAKGRLLGSSFLIFGHLNKRERVEQVTENKVIESGGLEIILPDRTKIHKPVKESRTSVQFLRTLDAPIIQPIAILDSKAISNLTEHGTYVSLVIKMLFMEHIYLRDCKQSPGKCSFLSEELQGSMQDIREFYLKEPLRKEYRLAKKEKEHILKIEEQIKKLNGRMQERALEFHGIEAHLQKTYLVSSPKYFRIVPGPAPDTAYR